MGGQKAAPYPAARLSRLLGAPGPSPSAHWSGLRKQHRESQPRWGTSGRRGRTCYVACGLSTTCRRGAGRGWGSPSPLPVGPGPPTRGSMSRPQGIRRDLHTRPAGHLAGSGRGLRQATPRQLGAGVTSSPPALRRRSAPHPAGPDPPGAPAVPADSAHQTTHDVEDSG